ncbi:glycosyltransferase family 4 protein [Campylobacter gracilis]|uniref:Glycosyltransferase, group 1 family protein n=1 Tax=Campylobacter gracilis RM3268 TaxID=553220 RepID=C8PJU8_9BACT|nr:glycosyltransferase family 4 protein [Campylobacter gracilis]AKT92199.1 glycosyltransferase, family 1 [Campylobacter gracilis]EEV17203.1 glycosyltransferase, group 1 family protein [Campylobacter gracilis RM3268]UEB45611.1 glycosyltransferase family 4 protein [Campylobacter gracilis]SUW81715.1 aldehyde dehydrogenase [Campylobacter gracilis]
MKKALIHDWFSTYAGAEKCVESFTDIWDDFEIYSLIDFLSDADRNKILKGKRAHTSFIQKLPFAKDKYRNYLPLFPLAIEQFDLSGYDVVLSSSHAVAKGVLTHSNQLHIAYVHTPIRYAWDLYYQYLRESGLDRGLKGMLAKYFLHKIRLWDASTANRVDHYVANSRYIARRIKKTYGKPSDVIYPPVDVDKFTLREAKEDFYLTASRMVPYKKIDLIVEAFSQTDKKLLVIGDGPDMAKIKSKAGKNVELLGFTDDETMADLMGRAKAFVFAAEEDFGITPVEAQACGTPVICFGRGGARETVLDGESGLYFMEQNTKELLAAVAKFEQNYDKFEPVKIRENSLKFSRARFEAEIKSYVEKKYEEFKDGLND